MARNFFRSVSRFVLFQVFFERFLKLDTKQMNLLWFLGRFRQIDIEKSLDMAIATSALGATRLLLSQTCILTWILGLAVMNWSVASESRILWGIPYQDMLARLDPHNITNHLRLRIDVGSLTDKLGRIWIHLVPAQNVIGTFDEGGCDWKQKVVSDDWVTFAGCHIANHQLVCPLILGYTWHKVPGLFASNHETYFVKPLGTCTFSLTLLMTFSLIHPLTDRKQ